MFKNMYDFDRWAQFAAYYLMGFVKKRGAIFVGSIFVAILFPLM